MTSQVQQTPYERLGGDAVLRRVVIRFYELMELLPEAREIRLMHQSDLSSAQDKLFKFMSGWLGGPPLYVEEYGHPFLRARHLPFAIGDAERDAWMLCMRGALDELVTDLPLKESLLEALQGLADHMRNR